MYFVEHLSEEISQLNSCANRRGHFWVGWKGEGVER